MVKKRLLYSLLLVFTLACGRLSAQESMMQDVDYAFLNKLIDTAYMYYPRVKTFDHRNLVNKELLKKAQLSWFDMFTFSYVYSPNNSTTLVNPSVLNGYQFGVYFNIASIISKPHTIKQAKEEMIITKLEQDTYLLNLTAEVKSRYFRYISQVTMLKQRSLVAIDAENIVKQLKYKFEKSEESFETYNRVLVQYSDRKQAVIQAEADMLIAKSFLEEMITKKLEDIK